MHTATNTINTPIHTFRTAKHNTPQHIGRNVKCQTLAPHLVRHTAAAENDDDKRRAASEPTLHSPITYTPFARALLARACGSWRIPDMAVTSSHNSHVDSVKNCETFTA